MDGIVHDLAVKLGQKNFYRFLLIGPERKYNEAAFRALWFGQGQMLVAIARLEGKKAAEQISKQVLRLFLKTILKLEDDSVYLVMANPQAWSLLGTVSPEAKKAAERFNALFTKQPSPERGKFTPDYRAFWLGCQSIIGGGIDEQVVSLLEKEGERAVISWLEAIMMSGALDLTLPFLFLFHSLRDVQMKNSA